MFWGVTIESGKRYSQIVESSYHLSMAALEPNCKEATNKFVSVMIEHGKTEFLLCTLEYDRIMQVPLDLLFIEGEEVSFFLNGEGVVHLTGYVTDNEDKTAELTSDQSSEESENLSDEESELSDQDPDNTCSKLMALDSESESTGEEWTPEKALSKKRKKLLTRSNIPKLQSLEEKKPQKPDKESKSFSITESVEKSKQKTNQTNKKNISVSSDSESDEEMEEDDEEEEVVDEDEEEEEESEDEDDESEEDTDDDKNKSSASLLKKKKIGSKDASIVSPKQTLTPSEFKKGLNKTPSQNESRSSNTNASKSIETPASKKKQETSFKRKSNENLQTPSGNKACHTPKTINEVPASSSSGKKKRKRSLKKDENSSFSESSKKDTPSMKLQGGIKITDIKQGNGPQAKKGRFVHVCYVGRLNSGVEFDSAKDRPFSFRLGCGEVIKGLDTGIEGMKVGGKRKVVVPPVLGYGNKKVGPIPPNSTLQFEVELKAVS